MKKTKAIYEDQLPGGIGDDMTPLDFDEKALKEGTEHELEHTFDPELAQEIAIDHLTEDPLYYEKLKKIESKAKMKLVLGYGTGYYPYTQKPVDYQPYRPIYMYRGPPPDAGFSYGIFEDSDTNEIYYAEMGLEPFSPFTGKPAKMVQEVNFQEMERELQDAWKAELMENCECKTCGAEFVQNAKHYLKGRDHFFCHRCGAQL